jgi:serine protease SohB
MELVFEYFGFLARAVTVVIALLIVLGFIFANAMRRSVEPEGVLEVKHLNAELEDLKFALASSTSNPAELKRLNKERKKQKKAEAKEQPGKADAPPAGRVYVLNFTGDLQASTVEALRVEITSVLTNASAVDEVVVRLESAGGLVHAYGLAASQLDRVRQQGVPLTATIDKVAASGGYMMAAVADKIISAPFAVVGSIGVVAQIPNVHRLLKKHEIDVDIITAGAHKRTLTVLGENTEEGREKFTEQLEDVHALFQEYLLASRPQLDMSKVATGESWYGQRALDLQLVDRIMTSDSYLLELAQEREVYEICWRAHKKPLERLLGQFSSAFAKFAASIGSGLSSLK